jgi:hypothetical protein
MPQLQLQMFMHPPLLIFLVGLFLAEILFFVKFQQNFDKIKNPVIGAFGQ